MIRKTVLSAVATVAFSTAAFAGGHAKDIVDTAVGAGDFTTLVAAVEAAGLVDTLKGMARSPYLPRPTPPLLRCPRALSRPC